MDIKALGKNAFFVANRNDLVNELQTHLSNDCVLLLMGARDPSLEVFGKEVWEKL
jgi:UDP-N-acetylmuramate--alanine ligase